MIFSFQNSTEPSI